MQSSGQIAGLRARTPEIGLRSNVVEVELRDTEFDFADLQRNFFAASSCGICGKASINAIRTRGLRQPDTGFRLDPEVLCRLPEIAPLRAGGFQPDRRPARCGAV